MNTNVKHIVGEIKSGSADGVYQAWATTLSIDRSNEVVIPEGVTNIKDYVSKNPIMYYDHAWAGGMFSGTTEESLPIGKVIAAEIVKGKGIKIDFSFSSLPFAQKIKTLVDEKILNSISIGFIPNKSETDPQVITQELTQAGMMLTNQAPDRVITKWEMLENSVVGIPCNRDAVILNGSDKIKKIIAEIDEELSAKKSMLPVEQKATEIKSVTQIKVKRLAKKYKE
jgi:hypothetical protein